MQKLLFISPELPYPLRSGGKVKSNKLLSMLSEQYEVTLVCPLKLEDAEFLDEFRSKIRLANIVCEPIDVPRSATNLLRSYLRGIPLNLLRSYVPSLAEFINANHARYDKIFIDHYEAYQYVPAYFAGKVIYHAHNAYFKMWQRYADTSRNLLYRWVTAFEAKRVLAQELAICNAADLVFAAPNDIEELTSLGAQTSKFRPTYHLGDDTQLALPDIEFAQTEERLLYVGFLGWEPNAAGLLWFLEHVWPSLKQQRPDLQFDIIGKKPDQRIQAIAIHDESIHLHGFVADLEDYTPKCRVSVAPLQFGSGMKVKVLSAMARGLPIVTTDVGAEGISVESGLHMMVANNPEDTAKAVIDLMDNVELWTSLRNNSRQLIREKYTWEALFKAMYTEMEAIE